MRDRNWQSGPRAISANPAEGGLSHSHEHRGPDPATEKRQEPVNFEAEYRCGNHTRHTSGDRDASPPALDLEALKDRRK